MILAFLPTEIWNLESFILAVIASLSALIYTNLKIFMFLPSNCYPIFSWVIVYKLCVGEFIGFYGYISVWDQCVSLYL